MFPAKGAGVESHTGSPLQKTKPFRFSPLFRAMADPIL